MRSLIAGNWKMFGLRDDVMGHLETLRELSDRTQTCDLLILPPITLLQYFVQALSDTRIMVGGQNCHTEIQGSHTGEISAEMLADSGCAYVVVGHSERRREFGETGDLIRRKAEAAHCAGLSAVICIGESSAVRKSGQHIACVLDQLRQAVPATACSENTTIAYEPVWAIGTGRVATTSEIDEVHTALRAELSLRDKPGSENTRIIYGGSVDPTNVGAILAVPEVNGVLVGRASLDPVKFAGIVNIALEQVV